MTRNEKIQVPDQLYILITSSLKDRLLDVKKKKQECTKNLKVFSIHSSFNKQERDQFNLNCIRISHIQLFPSARPLISAQTLAHQYE